MKRRVLVVVGLLLGCFNAYAEYAGVDAILSTRASYFNSSAVDQPAPEGWESNYHPQGGSMGLDKSGSGSEWSFALGLEPVWSIASVGWTIGIPVIYTVPFIDSGQEIVDFKTTVGKTTVDWWDEVSLLEVQMQRELPAVGISLRKRDSNWGFQYLVQPYGLSLVEFKGVDHVGGANESKPRRRESSEEGLGHVFELSYGSPDSDSPDGITLRFEQYGADVWSVSIGLSVSPKLLNPFTPAKSQ